MFFLPVWAPWVLTWQHLLLLVLAAPFPEWARHPVQMNSKPQGPNKISFGLENPPKFFDALTPSADPGDIGYLGSTAPVRIRVPALWLPREQGGQQQPPAVFSESPEEAASASNRPEFPSQAALPREYGPDVEDDAEDLEPPVDTTTARAPAQEVKGQPADQGQADHDIVFTVPADVKISVMSEPTKAVEPFLEPTGPPDFAEEEEEQIPLPPPEIPIQTGSFASEEGFPVYQETTENVGLSGVQNLAQPLPLELTQELGPSQDQRAQFSEPLQEEQASQQDTAVDEKLETSQEVTPSAVNQSPAARPPELPHEIGHHDDVQTLVTVKYQGVTREVEIRTSVPLMAPTQSSGLPGQSEPGLDKQQLQIPPAKDEPSATDEEAPGRRAELSEDLSPSHRESSALSSKPTAGVAYSPVQQWLLVSPSQPSKDRSNSFKLKNILRFPSLSAVTKPPQAVVPQPSVSQEGTAAPPGQRPAVSPLTVQSPHPVTGRLTTTVGPAEAALSPASGKVPVPPPQHPDVIASQADLVQPLPGKPTEVPVPASEPGATPSPGPAAEVKPATATLPTHSQPPPTSTAAVRQPEPKAAAGPGQEAAQGPMSPTVPGTTAPLGLTPPPVRTTQVSPWLRKAASSPSEHLDLSASTADQVQLQDPKVMEVTQSSWHLDLTTPQDHVSRTREKGVLSTEEQTASTAPGICELCTCTHTTLSCTALHPMQRLHQVPVLPPGAHTHTISELNLQGNAIPSLGKAAWENYPFLEKLNVSENHLTELRADSLEGLELLQSLDLSCNKIQWIERDTFKSLPFLRFLNLRCNLLTDVSFGTLRTWHGMQFLHGIILSSNPLTAIDDTNLLKLPALKYLDLGKTQVRFDVVENILTTALKLEKLILPTHLACCLCRYKGSIEVVCETVTLRCDSCPSHSTHCPIDVSPGNTEGALMKALQARKKSSSTQLTIEPDTPSSAITDITLKGLMQDELDFRDASSVISALHAILPYFTEGNVIDLDSIISPFIRLLLKAPSGDNSLGDSKTIIQDPSIEPAFSISKYKEQLKKLLRFRESPISGADAPSEPSVGRTPEENPTVGDGAEVTVPEANSVAPGETVPDSTTPANPPAADVPGTAYNPMPSPESSSGDEFERILYHQLQAIIPQEPLRNFVAQVASTVRTSCMESSVQLSCAKLVARTGLLIKLLSEQQATESDVSKGPGALSEGPQPEQGPEVRLWKEPKIGKKFIAVITMSATMVLINVFCLIEYCARRRREDMEKPSRSLSHSSRRTSSKATVNEKGLRSWWPFWPKRCGSPTNTRSEAQEIPSLDSSDEEEIFTRELTDVPANILGTDKTTEGEDDSELEEVVME